MTSFAEPPMPGSTAPGDKKSGGGFSGIQKMQRVGVTLVDSAAVNVLNNINLGFSLAAALAWNETVKFILEKHVTIKRARYYHIVYASILTLLATLISVLTTWIKPGVNSQPTITGMVR